MTLRQAEFNRLRAEREERINQIIQSRKQEREAKRKMLFYLRSEEERMKKAREEEEAHKREGNILYVDLHVQSQILISKYFSDNHFVHKYLNMMNIYCSLRP